MSDELYALLIVAPWLAAVIGVQLYALTRKRPGV